ncbi:MAG: DUF5107 domain-containing protein [Terriglobia bacterium]
MNGHPCQKLAIVFAAVLVSAFPPAVCAQEHAVRVWEEPLVIPTYRVGAPEKNPIFYGGRAYQGARGAVYPYPMLDKLTDIRENKTYRAVYLENQFVKICVIPELGGRIFSAEDKTNQYDFFYRQHVIKPALIGMLGAWISGGVEWNIPHHHRATTFMTIDHTIEENSDGSRTVWVGEIELRHRMKWVLGLTLYPDRSYIEATVKLFNRTPLVNSFLYFSNASVYANENYQVIFPPGTEYATFHGKTHFTHWPISHEVFNGVDYTRGVDLSWWKNHPSPTSFFAWNYEDDFFGGYDHGKQAGVVHVADHHIVPGKKFWEFANGGDGRMWDKILTETDGPYIELMSGAYSDNQPDYSWIQPYEVKTWKQYWYPIRGMGGFKNANTDAAVNLDLGKDGTLRVGINATREFAGARVMVKSHDHPLLEDVIDVGPDKPYLKEISVSRTSTQEEIRISVTDSEDREIISYAPRPPKNEPMPALVKPPPPPKDIKSVEELYLTGLRAEQFYNPAVDPEAYYAEALRRDPGYSAVNTAMGILYCRRGMYEEAEAKLRAALARVTKDYTSPKDGEALYYLGVALESQGRDSEAEDAYSKATWSRAWQGAGDFQLAQLYCRKREFTRALEHADRAITASALNTKALNIKTAALRHLGRNEEAAQLASLALKIDPLDFLAGNELYLARTSAGSADEARAALEALTTKMRGELQSYLETALDYADCGLWDEAIGVLTRRDDAAEDKDAASPMLYYFLGYFHEQKGEGAESAKYYRLASQAKPDFCFPFRLEASAALKAALRHNPQDARAHYYLGNLLYERQPERAIKEWEAARELEPNFATAHRNLGLAYARVEKDLQKGIASLEKAFEYDPKDATVLYELDRFSQEAGIAPEKRLARLEANQTTTLERDDALQQELVLYVLLGRYDKAIDLLTRRHFHAWEGGGDIHDVYIDARLMRGQQHMKNQRYAEALADFTAALEYPENLEVGRPENPPRDAEIHYHLGTVYEAQGDRTQARSHFATAAAGKTGLPEGRYFQGLALRKLGREAEAGRVFDGLLSSGREELQAVSDDDYFAKFGEKRPEATRISHARFLMGLGYLGQGKRMEAKAEFERALEKNINHLWARAYLADLR